MTASENHTETHDTGQKKEDWAERRKGVTQTMIRVSCWNCRGEIYVDHDCGEDTCCCLNPVDNVVCDVCEGRGYWLVKPTPEAYRKLSESEDAEYDEVEVRMPA